MTKTGPRDDTKLAAIKLEWWPRSDCNRWPPSLESASKTGMAQEQFASAFGFTVHQVRQWEQGRHRPLGAMRAYLMVIDRNHEGVLAMLRDASETQRA